MCYLFPSGASYTFSQGDSLQEQIADPTYFNFLKAVMEQSGTSPSSEYPRIYRVDLDIQ